MVASSDGELIGSVSTEWVEGYTVGGPVCVCVCGGIRGGVIMVFADQHKIMRMVSLTLIVVSPTRYSLIPLFTTASADFMHTSIQSIHWECFHSWRTFTSAFNYLPPPPPPPF